MRKILRMFLVMVLATIGFNANAGTIVFADLGLENGVQYTNPFDGGDFTVQFVGGGNDGKYYNTGSGIRMYGGGTMKIGAKSGSITKVIVTWDGSYKPTASDVVNVGSYDVESGIWTGKSDSVFFTRPTGTGNWRVQKLEVTIEGGSTITVPTPSISGTTPFTESTEVKISGTPEGGKTYYTTDGSDPTSSSTLYSDPFTLTETTTVKAISYDKDGNASSVASKTFTKETIEKAANIAALLAFEKGKKVTVTLNNAIVLYKGTNDIIIKDATGGTDFYQTGLELTKGQVLNGTITVLRDDYNGFKEAKKTDGTNLDNVTVTEGTVTPTNSTVANVATSEDCADLYKLENVEVVANGSNWDIVDGETTLRLRDQFKLNYTATAGKFNIIGVIGNYNGTKQFWPTEAPEATQEITIGEVSDINEFKAQPKGKPYKMTLENAQVVYSWTSTNGNVQSYVRDETGALCFFFAKGYEAVSDKFAVNNILNGSIVMQSNNSQTRADAIEQSNENTLTSTTGTAAEPVKIDATKVSEYLNDLVLLENVTIEEKDGKYYVGDVQLYNGMYVESFDTEKKENFSSFVGEGKNVKGIAVVYNTTYEIYPIEITSQGGGETPATSGVMIKFTESDTAGEGKVYSNGDFKLTQTADTDNKTAIDASKNDYFGTADNYQKISVALKTGGKSSSKNSMMLTIPSDGTLKVYVRTGSNSATDRTLVLTQNGEELYNKVVQEADAVEVNMSGDNTNKVYPVISVSVKAGEVTVGYPVGSLNFYAFEFIAGTDGIQNVVKPVVENGIRYNLAGQRVDENYKGVVIMNGKKYVVK